MPTWWLEGCDAAVLRDEASTSSASPQHERFLRELIRQRTIASIAPCRMKAAAALSTRVARLARLTSAAIIAGSTEAVDQRSYQSRRGRPGGRRLRATARVIGVRGRAGPERQSVV